MDSIPYPELLKLSAVERVRLAQALWDSVADEPESLPLTEAQRQEIRRRSERHRQNPEEARPWEEVYERALRSL